MRYAEFNTELLHWSKWQPELLSQYLGDGTILYPFMFGVNIYGFNRMNWPVIKVDGLEMNITGEKYREGDSLTEIFIPTGAQFSDLTLGIVTMKGDNVLEKWIGSITKIIMRQYINSNMPSDFQPDEIEFFDRFRRDIMIHYLDFDRTPLRSVLIKKALPIKHSLSPLDSLSSGLSVTNVTFNVGFHSHGV